MRIILKGTYPVMNFSGLDTPSGHIVCGFGLALLGALFYKMGVPHSEEAIVSGFTIIGMAMKGLNGGNIAIIPKAQKQSQPESPSAPAKSPEP